MISNRTIIAFDFGNKSIGVAIGHELISKARPLAAFKAQHGSPDWHKIDKLLQEWQPDLVVVGLPLSIDGCEQVVTRQARKFAKRLHGRFGIQIILHDERFSTVEARANLFNAGGFRALDKGHVDSVAALIILEGWFGSQEG